MLLERPLDEACSGFIILHSDGSNIEEEKISHGPIIRGSTVLIVLILAIATVFQDLLE